MTQNPKIFYPYLQYFSLIPHIYLLILVINTVCWPDHMAFLVRIHNGWPHCNWKKTVRRTLIFNWTLYAFFDLVFQEASVGMIGLSFQYHNFYTHVLSPVITHLTNSEPSRMLGNNCSVGVAFVKSLIVLEQILLVLVTLNVTQNLSHKA